MAQAYSANSNSQTGDGFLSLNAVNVSFGGNNPNDLRANIFVIDTSDCTVAGKFVSEGGDSAGELRQYLDQMSARTVVVGVSADGTGSYSDAAEVFVTTLGVNVTDVSSRGAWVFVVEIGAKTMIATAPNATVPQPSVTASFTGT